MKKIFVFNALVILTALAILLNINFINSASAHGEDNFAEAEEIIKQKISCGNLSDAQLEILGDYYMEQMHPGELHEIMDDRMGGEGSESLKQTHIAIARAFYCGEHGMMNAGMMNALMGRNYGYGMMRMMNYSDYSVLAAVLVNVFLILLIVLIVFLIIKLSRGMKGGNKRR